MSGLNCPTQAKERLEWATNPHGSFIQILEAIEMDKNLTTKFRLIAASA